MYKAFDVLFNDAQSRNLVVTTLLTIRSHLQIVQTTRGIFTKLFDDRLVIVCDRQFVSCPVVSVLDCTDQYLLLDACTQDT
jgi:hypothetical protein